MLPRVQWFEFNELAWMPRSLRHGIQRSIGFDQWVQGCFRGELPRRFVRWLERTGADEVLDLGSGGGGPVLSLLRGARRCLGGQDKALPTFHLSDIAPELHRFAELTAHGPVWEEHREREHIRFVQEPVDALADPLPCPQRFFTLINIAHHFPPDLVRRILANLVRQGDGVFVVDTYYRSVRFVPMMIASLVPSWVAPLVVRPFRWSHLLWGTLIPIVPLLVMHDGLTTVLRCYRPDEWQRLVDGLPGGEAFEWEIDRLRNGVVYVAGWRRAQRPPGLTTAS